MLLLTGIAAFMVIAIAAALAIDIASDSVHQGEEGSTRVDPDLTPMPPL